MGRGRKGLIEQSERKPKATNMLTQRKGSTMDYFYVPNVDKKNLYLTEEAVEIMKQMNLQQLVNILLPNDDWHVKTSARNASGSWPNVKHANKVVVYTSVKAKNSYDRSHVLYLKPRICIFCLFHRLNNITRNASDFFLPSRDRKFADNVANNVEQNNHCIYIHVIYSKHKAHAYHATEKKNHKSNNPWAGAK